MITQHNLKPNIGAKKSSRARGRGDGSGRGSFRKRRQRPNGTIRRQYKAGFEGGQTPLIRRLPKLKGFKNPNKTPYQVVNVEKLEVFEDGATVNIVSLRKRFYIQKNRPVKLLEPEN